MGKTDEEILKELGLEISRVRKLRKMSQSSLGKETGIDRSYISMVERGETNITYLKLRKISEVLQFIIKF